MASATILHLLPPFFFPLPISLPPLPVDMGEGVGARGWKEGQGESGRGASGEEGGVTIRHSETRLTN